MSASDDEFCNCDWGTQKEEVPTPPPPPPPPPPEQMPLPSASVNGFSNRNWGNTQNRKEKPSQPPPPSQQARLGSASDDEFCNSDWGTQKEEVPPPPPPEQVPMPSSSGNGFSNCDWGNTQNRKGKPPQPLPQEAVNGFSNCNWGNTQNRKEVPRQPPPPPPPQQMPMPSSSANGFSNCDWGTQKKKVPPPPPQQMPLPSACPCPCPCPVQQTRPITPSNILYVEGIEEYRNQLPLLRVEEIARVFFLHIPNVNVVDVKRLLHWDDNHYAVVELDTVEHAKKAISILNGITLSTGHTLTVYFCNLAVSLAPSNSALLRLKAERRRNDSRIVFVEEPVEGEKFSGAQDETTAPQQPFSNETEEEDADDDDATSEYSSCSSGNACVRPNTVDSDSEAASGSEEETNDEDE